MKYYGWMEVNGNTFEVGSFVDRSHNSYDKWLSAKARHDGDAIFGTDKIWVAVEVEVDD